MMHTTFKKVLALVTGFLLIGFFCPDIGHGTRPVVNQDLQISVDRLPAKISKGRAISIALRRARETRSLPGTYRIVTCELSMLWAVIFDGGGPEFLIDKDSGVIRRIRMVDQTWSGVRQLKVATNLENITATDAIDIAKRDYHRELPYDDITRLSFFVCELDEVWRVFVEYKIYLDPLTKQPVVAVSDAPNYVIDKTNGAILLKSR